MANVQLTIGDITTAPVDAAAPNVARTANSGALQSSHVPHRHVRLIWPLYYRFSVDGVHLELVGLAAGLTGAVI